MGAPVAVITGASRGIGQVLARGFAQAGWAVIEGNRQVADMANPAAVTAWAQTIMAEHGDVGLLINNAGVIDEEVPLEESDPEQWWRIQEINVRAPYLMTRALLPGMLAAGSGRIININSGAGTRAGSVATSYNTSKTALARLTGSTALSGAGRGVYAFDLAPGVVRTDMTASMPSQASRTEWTDPQDVLDLALALASGELDAWSGRMVRAGADTPASLAAAAASLDEEARTVTLLPFGSGDPLA